MPNIQDVSPTKSNTDVETDGQSVNGRVLALACSQDGRVVFAGSYSNIWASKDAGQTWDQVAWPQPAAGQFGVPGSLGGWCVVDIAVSPVDSQTVLAITRFDREFDRKSGDSGIWRSTDSGNNWARVHRFPQDTKAGQQIPPPAGQLVWAPGSDRLVFAAGGSALAISQDGGATFKDVVPPEGGQFRINHVAVSRSPPEAPGLPMVYALGDGAMFVSSDGGANWTQDRGPIPPNWGGAVGAEGNSQAPSVLVVSSRSPFEVFLVANANGGRTVSPAAVSGPGVSAYKNQQHFAYLDNAGTIWDSWWDGDNNRWNLQQINKAGMVWLLSDGGIYWSTDGGKHFQAAHNVRTLACVNVAGVAIEGLGTALSLNTGDNDGFYSINGGANWTSQDYGGGDNDCSFADPLRPHSMLVFTPRWDTQGNLGAAVDGQTVAIYESSPGQLPNVRLGTNSRHIVPGPPLSNKWNASSPFVLRGFRPIVLSLPGEDVSAQGDYIFIRFKAERCLLLIWEWCRPQADIREPCSTWAVTQTMNFGGGLTV
jgi:hypothetical protein